MKFSLTKYELFAITRHLYGLPSPNPEHGRKRLRAWEELGVTELADKLETMQAGFGGEIKISDWDDKTTPIEVELSRDIVTHIIAGLGGEVRLMVDVINRVRERLEKAE